MFISDSFMSFWTCLQQPELTHKWGVNISLPPCDVWPSVRTMTVFQSFSSLVSILFRGLALFIQQFVGRILIKHLTIIPSLIIHTMTRRPLLSENSRADTPLKNGNWMDDATTVCTFGVFGLWSPLQLSEWNSLS